MPPFKLEAYKYVPGNENKEKIVHTKQAYNPKVKITDWQRKIDSEPIDHDPRASGNLDQRVSHYDRLGAGPDDDFVTTTQLMLEQIRTQERIPELSRHAVNYYTLLDNLDCDQQSIIKAMCPKVCAEKYYSTMQNSYRPTSFFKLRRVALPVIPHLQNRKFLIEEPHLSDYKFYDEGFHLKTQSLIKHKVCHWKSYNPMTGMYNDGTAPDTGERKCVHIDYDGI